MFCQTNRRYRIVECLGEGGIGVVFRAEDPRLERDVALKILKQDVLYDKESKRNFRVEARALSRLLHPDIATLFDFDSDRGIDIPGAQVRARRVA
jgi:eukaryotic-like serine/threonine-protein kinase